MQPTSRIAHNRIDAILARTSAKSRPRSPLPTGRRPDSSVNVNGRLGLDRASTTGFPINSVNISRQVKAICIQISGGCGPQVSTPTCYQGKQFDPKAWRCQTQSGAPCGKPTGVGHRSTTYRVGGWCTRVIDAITEDPSRQLGSCHPRLN